MCINTDDAQMALQTELLGCRGPQADEAHRVLGQAEGETQVQGALLRWKNVDTRRHKDVDAGRLLGSSLGRDRLRVI